MCVPPREVCGCWIPLGLARLDQFGAPPRRTSRPCSVCGRPRAARQRHRYARGSVAPAEHESGCAAHHRAGVSSLASACAWIARAVCPARRSRAISSRVSCGARGRARRRPRSRPRSYIREAVGTDPRDATALVVSCVLRLTGPIWSNAIRRLAGGGLCVNSSTRAAFASNSGSGSSCTCGGAAGGTGSPQRAPRRHCAGLTAAICCSAKCTASRSSDQRVNGTPACRDGRRRSRRSADGPHARYGGTRTQIIRVQRAEPPARWKS